MTSFEQKLQYGNTTINYAVIRSNRRKKTSQITVRKDGKVTVRSPFDKPIHEIEDFIQQNARWILQKQLEYKRITTHQIMKATFEEGSTLPYLGRNYPLRIMNYPQKKQNEIQLVNEEFLVSIDNSKPSKRKIRDLYEDWLMQQSHSIFDEKVKQYSIQLGVQPRQVMIKNLKSRWGSATKDKVINLNVNLLKASEDVIDYVILHELCHIKIKAHSHHFWDLLHKFMPNYYDNLNWLKINGNNLIH